MSKGNTSTVSILLYFYTHRMSTDIVELVGEYTSEHVFWVSKKEKTWYLDNGLGQQTESSPLVKPKWDSENVNATAPHSWLLLDQLCLFNTATITPDYY